MKHKLGTPASEQDLELLDDWEETLYALVDRGDLVVPARHINTISIFLPNVGAKPRYLLAAFSKPLASNHQETVWVLIDDEEISVQAHAHRYAAINKILPRTGFHKLFYPGEPDWKLLIEMPYQFR